ncbi:hypothetical protein E2C01_085546 [Portunus trituberculatus]|uniref:Uncharacterized protein n=1 Tax=Portunus trituberculatus TaxID=210409 RepID=A0A5B7J7W3_PORTR|nr:hypothetical protein [Portunus trituberculatus]
MTGRSPTRTVWGAITQAVTGGRRRGSEGRVAADRGRVMNLSVRAEVGNARSRDSREVTMKTAIPSASVAMHSTKDLMECDAETLMARVLIIARDLAATEVLGVVKVSASVPTDKIKRDNESARKDGRKEVMREDKE